MSLNSVPNSTTVESWYVVVNTAAPPSVVHYSVATQYLEQQPPPTGVCRHGRGGGFGNHFKC